MNHVTTITIDRSGAFWAKSADGATIAMARFDFPPRAEDGVEIMRQRAEWLARFPGARVTDERSPRSLVSTAEHRRDLSEVLLSLNAHTAAPGEVVSWSKHYGADWETAISGCPLRDWLFWIACALEERGHLKKKAIVAMACASTRSVLCYARAGEDRPRLAVEAVERWIRGDATMAEVHAARCTGPADTAGSDAAARAALYTVNATTSTRTQTSINWAYCAVAAVATHVGDAPALVEMKRAIGPALIAGLEAYASTLPGASR